MSRSEFWNSIYQTKNEPQQSWFQDNPIQSLEVIESLKLPKDASIIDIGGGESRLVDYLFAKGYLNLSVLDVSSVALEKSKSRLKEKAEKINFIAADVLELSLESAFDLWHDRAAFHFFTNKEDITKYIQVANRSLKSKSFLILSSFSLNGPDKCSGLVISKYSKESLNDIFSDYFQLINSFEYTHITPWGSNQQFIYTVFQKKA